MNLEKLLSWSGVVRAMATRSRDRSKKVAAIAFGSGETILSTGYNGFPRGVDERPDDRHERPMKYIWTSHAEENMVANAARTGTSLDGSKVLLYGLPPCSTCARLMVQAGVAEILVITDKGMTISQKWTEDQVFSRQILEEGNVKLTAVEESYSS